MTTRTIAISAIDTSNRLRPIDEANAQAISASIEDHGLIQPIVVQPVGDGYRLTAGGHRLAAMIALGWKELKVGEHVVIREEETDDDARQTEIFENIFRGELTALDRMIALAEAKRIYDAKRVAPPRGRHRKDVEFKEEKNRPETGLIFSERFTDAAAKRMGLSVALIKEAVSIAAALSPAAIKALRGTMIAGNQNELRLLAKYAASEQASAARAIRDGEAKNVQQAMVHIGVEKALRHDPQKQIYVTLNDLWEKANARTRAQFLADIGAELIGNGKKA